MLLCLIIKKRNGNYRTIYEPNKILKHIQRKILSNILEDIKVSEYAKAYHKNISIVDNAIVHVKSKVILKTDPIPEGWRKGRICK